MKEHIIQAWKRQVDRSALHNDFITVQKVSKIIVISIRRMRWTFLYVPHKHTMSTISTHKHLLGFHQSSGTVDANDQTTWESKKGISSEIQDRSPFGIAIWKITSYFRVQRATVTSLGDLQNLSQPCDDFVRWRVCRLVEVNDAVADCEWVMDAWLIADCIHCDHRIRIPTVVV